jgi:cell division protein FtsA
VLDIGGGTTDLALFQDESIRFTSIIGLGGKNVTSDIAIGLRTPMDQAEEIKINYGCALRSMVPKGRTILVPGPGDREPRNVSLEMLGTIIEPRMEELFTMAKREVEKTEYGKLIGSGVILTGGASLLRGSAELAEQIFDMPVKIGYPSGFNGLTDAVDNPAFSTALGLVMYEDEEFGGDYGGKGSGGGFFGNLKRWFKDFI